MKKLTILSILSALAVLSCGCGNKVSKDSEVTASNNNVSESTTDDEIVPELGTVRDRNIVSAENFDYEIYNGSVIITKYKGKESSVEIPAEIEDTPVTEVGFYAFEAKYDLVSITLPESVTTIGEGAFMDCASLTSINLPSGLTNIQRGAFVSCASLTELTIPAAVQRIEEEAFTACEGMTSLTILNPDLKYESWGLEALPDLTVYAQEGSAAAEWAGAMGKFAAY